MNRKIVTVVRGASAWVGLRGWLLYEDGDFVVGKFWSQDDGGKGIYRVRFPKACVTIEDETPQA